jgi:hypothetical protein
MRLAFLFYEMLSLSVEAIDLGLEKEMWDHVR